MLFILLLIILWTLDWKCDLLLLFRFLGTLVLCGVILVLASFVKSDSAIQSNIPIQTESFVTSGFTQVRSGKRYFIYSNESGTFQIPANSIQSKEGTENKIETYKTTYPKIYKYMFFFQDKKYYKIEIKP